jgi:hypothetical protein
VLCGSTLEAIVHLQDALPGLVAERHGRRLLVVPTGSYGYGADDIARTLEVDVAPSMPDDRGAAAALSNQRHMRRLEKTPLLMWAEAMIAELGIDVLLTSTPTTEEPTHQSAFHQPSASAAEVRGPASKQSPDDQAALIAGTTAEARR